jgi:uncharacterized damage-inducible protein DinB
MREEREASCGNFREFHFPKMSEFEKTTRRFVMTLAEQFLREYEEQVPITRKFLERLPESKLTWKPHERSMTAGQLAYHLASVPAEIVRFVSTNPAHAPKSFEFPQPASVAEILKAHDEDVATVRSLLPTFSDAAMKETWRMMSGEYEVMAQPRAEFVRNIMFSHMYQHRGQFGVYLRLLNIAVPSTWGPSADEQPAFMRHAEVVV